LTNPKARSSRAIALGAALACSATWPGLAGAADAAELFYERALIGAAGARCNLFDSSVAAGLAASTRQARGAALRAGTEPDALEAAEARARARGSSIPCGSPDLAVAAERVRAAFSGYARVGAMDFPGGDRTWRAVRSAPSRVGASWRLSQAAAAPKGAVVFGIAAGEDRAESLTAVAGWPGALAASSARLVMRDPAKAGAPYLDRRARGLAAKAPPRSAARVFLASARAGAPLQLLPSGAGAGAAFRFPAAAAQALQALDPREAVLLELVYPTLQGERVESVPIEVGDFAAAVAFLSARTPGLAAR